jgi:hypothetical protein
MRAEKQLTTERAAREAAEAKLRASDMACAAMRRSLEDVANNLGRGNTYPCPGDPLRERAAITLRATNAGAAQLAELADKKKRLEECEARMPEGMKHCTIVLRQCDNGHSWLTAKNWVEFDCPWCQLSATQVKLAEAEGSIASMHMGLAKEKQRGDSLKADKERLEKEVDRLADKLKTSEAAASEEAAHADELEDQQPAKPAEASRSGSKPDAAEAVRDVGAFVITSRVARTMLALDEMTDHVSVLRGTEFPIARLFAGLADNKTIHQIAKERGLDSKNIASLLHAMAICLDVPAASEHAATPAEPSASSQPEPSPSLAEDLAAVDYLHAFLGAHIQAFGASGDWGTYTSQGVTTPRLSGEQRAAVVAAWPRIKAALEQSEEWLTLFHNECDNSAVLNHRVDLLTALLRKYQYRTIGGGHYKQCGACGRYQGDNCKPVCEIAAALTETKEKTDG